MGVKCLWQLMRAENLVTEFRSNEPADTALLAQQLDGKVIAVDLAVWMQQANEQAALVPHFSDVQRSTKVAFERSLQWLRFGITPVFVVEGNAPAEKAAAQQRRAADRAGRAGQASFMPSSSNGTSMFTLWGQKVATVLEAMGLPVIEAPGEAEATCAALCLAGAVDAVATSDSDALLYGSSTVYHELKLSLSGTDTVKAARTTLESLCRHLGLTAAGAGTEALMLIAGLAGCDYDEAGAEGVGAKGTLALIKELLGGAADDSGVIDAFETALDAGPDPTLAALTRCTGCAQCGHESGRRTKIQAHTEKNPCQECLASSGRVGDGCCCAGSDQPCQCAFHRRANERCAERILTKARQQPGMAARVRESAAVYRRQLEAARKHVQQTMALRGMQLGQRFTWQHRPSIVAIHSIIEGLPGEKPMKWDLGMVRGKVLPALLEWDLREGARGASRAEFKPKAVKKVQGSGEADAGWRYLVEWGRTDVVVERALERKLHWREINAAGASQADASGNAGDSESPAAAGLSVVEFDRKWLAATGTTSSHRAVRQMELRRRWPAVEQAWQDKLLGKAGAGGRGKTIGARKSKAAAAEVMPRGAMERFLVVGRGSRRGGEGETRGGEDEAAKVAAAKFWGTGGSSSMGAAENGNGNGRQRGLEMEGDVAGPSSAAAIIGTASPAKKARSPSKLPGEAPDNSPLLQTLRTLVEKRTAREAAEGEKASRDAELAGMRERGAEVGRLLSGGGGPSQETEVVNLVDDDSPGEKKTSARRKERQQAQQEVIDLTDE